MRRRPGLQEDTYPIFACIVLVQDNLGPANWSITLPTVATSRLLPRSAQYSFPDEVEYRTNGPDTNQDRSLNRREHRASHDDKAADQSEQYWNEDKRLDRPLQVGLSETQYNGADYREEEESVFCESIESQQDPHIAEQNVH